MNQDIGFQERGPITVSIASSIMNNEPGHAPRKRRIDFSTLVRGPLLSRGHLEFPHASFIKKFRLFVLLQVKSKRHRLYRLLHCILDALQLRMLDEDDVDVHDLTGNQSVGTDGLRRLGCLTRRKPSSGHFFAVQVDKHDVGQDKPRCARALVEDVQACSFPRNAKGRFRLTQVIALQMQRTGRTAQILRRPFKGLGRPRLSQPRTLTDGRMHQRRGCRGQLKIDAFANSHHRTSNFTGLIGNVDGQLKFTQPIICDAQLLSKGPILLRVQHFDEKRVFFETRLENFFFEKELHVAQMSNYLLRYYVDSNVERHTRGTSWINQSADFEARATNEFHPGRMHLRRIDRRFMLPLKT